MRLKRKTLLRPGVPEPGGTFAGWFVPGTPYLVDATSESIRVWDTVRGALVNRVGPAERGLGRPNGAIAVYPGSPRVLTVHENSSRPYEGASVVLWRLPELKAVAERPGHTAVDPGLSMGSEKKHFLTWSSREASRSTPGLIVWDLDLRPVAKWNSPPPGEPVAVESRRWIVTSRCRSGRRGVEIRGYEGRRAALIAEESPVTHQVRCRRRELWLFQEEGLLEIWDAEGFQIMRTVDLGHSESMRDDFPRGAVVCLDDLDERTVLTLGTDGTVRIWEIPSWTKRAERPFEMVPMWIDVDPDRRLMAVGFVADGIELWSIG
jgi:WD40 repeat protein